jgi:HK97 gp10 family phage protein
MANNLSLERFRKLTDEMKRQVFDDAAAELDRQTDGLLQTMQSVAPRGESGDLEHSIRKIPGKTKLIWRLVAGGQLTIRRSVSAKAYDYARADEFGTVNMKARPFFFPTYRLRKKRIVAAMKRKLTATIKRYSAAAE